MLPLYVYSQTLDDILSKAVLQRSMSHIFIKKNRASLSTYRVSNSTGYPLVSSNILTFRVFYLIDFTSVPFVFQFIVNRSYINLWISQVLIDLIIFKSLKTYQKLSKRLPTDSTYRMHETKFLLSHSLQRQTCLCTYSGL